MGSTVPNFGHASSEGLGESVSDILKSHKDKMAATKSKPTKPTTPTKPTGQFADAPYSMGAPGAAGGTESGGGIEA
jgi:hypothetical protein